MKEWTYKLLPHLPHPPISLTQNINEEYRPEVEIFSPDDKKFVGIKRNEDWKNQSYDWIQPMASNRNMRQHFKDEFKSGIVFDKAGILAMANAGPKTNGSQFFITTAPTPWLNGYHTIFGRIISGNDVLSKLNNVQTNGQRNGDKPLQVQKILKATLLP